MVDIPENDILRKAIADAEVMLSHAARRGTALEQKDIENVVTARRALEEKNLTKEQETAFWNSSTSISKAIFPVTLETLAAATPVLMGAKTSSPAAAAATRYRVRTIVTLAALLLFQIYWLIGATVVTDLKDSRSRLEKEIYFQFVSAKRALDTLNQQNKTENAQKVDELAGQVDVLNEKLWIERISVHTNSEILSKWNIAKYLLLWKSSFIIPAAQKTPSTPVPAGAKTPEQAAPAPPPSQSSPLPEASAPKLRPEESAPSSPEDGSIVKPSDTFLTAFNSKNVVEMQTAQVVLTALLKYILPILYGALGASAFIVRTLTSEIRDLTYSPESNVRYQLRFYLGAVAGFSIAWFTSDTKSTEASGILQSLSPLALAFLAGYSVDLLFSLLDRLVIAFSTLDPKRSSSGS